MFVSDVLSAEPEPPPQAERSAAIALANRMLRTTSFFPGVPGRRPITPGTPRIESLS